MLMNNRVYWLC